MARPVACVMIAMLGAGCGLLLDLDGEAAPPTDGGTTGSFDIFCMQRACIR